jgi:hypothetical protein
VILWLLFRSENNLSTINCFIVCPLFQNAPTLRLYSTTNVPYRCSLESLSFYKCFAWKIFEYLCNFRWTVFFIKKIYYFQLLFLFTFGWCCQHIDYWQGSFIITFILKIKFALHNFIFKFFCHTLINLVFFQRFARSHFFFCSCQQIFDCCQILVLLVPSCYSCSLLFVIVVPFLLYYCRCRLHVKVLYFTFIFKLSWHIYYCYHFLFIICFRICFMIVVKFV